MPREIANSSAWRAGPPVNEATRKKRIEATASAALDDGTESLVWAFDMRTRIPQIMSGAMEPLRDGGAGVSPASPSSITRPAHSAIVAGGTPALPSPHSVSRALQPSPTGMEERGRNVRAFTIVE